MSAKVTFSRVKERKPRQLRSRIARLAREIRRGIAQADRGELIPHDQVISELRALLGKRRS